jgi:BASS family bile acid:Na+ symporter
MNEILNVALVASLVGLMFAMGLAVTPQDFRIALGQPRVVAIGMASILFLLPATAVAIATVMGLPPALAVGLVLVGACPGGLFSNLMTTYARGDLALSICLTTLSSLCTLVTLPLAANLALALFVGETRDVSVPVLPTMARILGIESFVASSLHLTKYIMRRFWNRPPGSGGPGDRAKLP